MAHPHQDTSSDGNRRRLLLALILTGGFMTVEVIGGIISGSLALLADAGHMLTDAAALGLAWWAFWVSQKPADTKRSYGYHRFQVLAALVNGLTLLVIVGWILLEAIRRLEEPGEILGGAMMAVAITGLVVNIIVFLILHGGDRQNLNMKAAAAHVIGDMLGSAGAIIAAIIIIYTGWTPIDPIISVLVALLILKSGWSLVRKSVHILLEGTPDWLDLRRLNDGLKVAVPGVIDAHHVHVWSLTSERSILTMHARIDQDTDAESALKGIKKFLKDEYAIGHSTIQIELEDCLDD